MTRNWLFFMMLLWFILALFYMLVEDNTAASIGCIAVSTIYEMWAYGGKPRSSVDSSCSSC